MLICLPKPGVNGSPGWAVLVIEAIITTSLHGEFAIAGYNDSFDGYITNNHGASDTLVVKLDANGNKLWQKTFLAVRRRH
jgi:hypothetical protein